MRPRSLSAGNRSFDDIGLFGMTGFSRSPNLGVSFVGLGNEWGFGHSTTPAAVFDKWVEVGKDTV